jgi:hypothetical protein
VEQRFRAALKPCSGTASAAEVPIAFSGPGEVGPPQSTYLEAPEFPVNSADGISEVLLAHKISQFVVIVLLTSPAWSDCLPFTEAGKHVGEVKCVAGTVIRVKQGARGVHFLDFCDDFRLCPFTVVIFPSDLKSVGDVRQLQGRMVEIHGQVKEYDGRAEIILEEYRQLGGPGARIPPLPKNYDVEKKGRYSAGTFSHPKAKRKTSGKQPPYVIAQAPEDPEQ